VGVWVAVVLAVSEAEASEAEERVAAGKTAVL
jgi:hypothetical protein